MQEAKIFDANLREANLSGVDLRRAHLNGAFLGQTKLRRANLGDTSLVAASLIGTDFDEAKLIGADLKHALLSRTNLSNADLTGSHVYGASVWDVNLNGATQEDIVITDDGESKITVDNLEVAQFIYLLLNNEKIRDVISTVANKAVLILGRFTKPRLAVLKEIKRKLRSLNYLPVLFDFEKPNDRDLTETVTTLAHLSKFIIADISTPKSVPQELQAIVPHLNVPVIPIIKKGQKPWGMFTDNRKYPWVLKLHRYQTVAELLQALERTLIPAAIERPQKLIEIQKQLDS